MKIENNNLIMIVMAGIILSIFGYVALVNVTTPIALNSILGMATNENQMYRPMPDSDQEIIDINAGIDMVIMTESNVNVIVYGEVLAYCVKTTKSTPTNNALCWQEITDDSINFSVIKGRRSYLWLKDTDNNISSRYTIQ